MPKPQAPGVYLTENQNLPLVIQPAATAIPAFIGHTERAADGKTDLTGTPHPLSTLVEYHLHFGEAPQPIFRIVPYRGHTGPSPLGPSGASLPPDLPEAEFDAGAARYTLEQTNPAYTLYAAIRHFFLNGGGRCYVTSVGSYDTPYCETRFLDAIAGLRDVAEPTLLVVPEAVRLPRAAAAAVSRAMLAHCGTDRRDRFAILDIPGGFLDRPGPRGDPVAAFRADIGDEGLDFGAAYYPWVEATVFSPADFTFENIDPTSRPLLDQLLRDAPPGLPVAASAGLTAPVLSGSFTIRAGADQPTVLTAAILSAQAASPAAVLQFHISQREQMGGRLVTSDAGAPLATFTQADLDAGRVSFVAEASAPSPGRFEVQVTDANGRTGTPRTVYVVADRAGANPPEVQTGLAASRNRHRAGVAALDASLRAAAPLYTSVTRAMARSANTLPPGAMMAGLYARTDASRGVWKAPAGIAADAVSGVTVPLTDFQQADLNAPPSGRSVNALRDFPGRGTQVWGARTLNGSSAEWRYVPVRRTAIFIETSLRQGLQAFVFAQNAPQTWASARGAVDSFLTGLWQQGALMGSRPSDAYFVQVGLGETMTQADIDAGIMSVMVGFAPVRPAEFVILRIQQKVAAPD